MATLKSDQNSPAAITSLEAQKRPSSFKQLSEAKKRKVVTGRNLLPETIVVREWESRNSIDSLRPTIGHCLWTGNCGSNTLNLLDSTGSVLQEAKSISDINNISLSPTTHRLWVCDEGCNIMELVSGQLELRFRTEEQPKCICATASNYVIVGTAKQVYKFTTQGQMLQTSNDQGTSKPLMCSPSEISECPITHNIAMTNHRRLYESESSECVVVTDSDFNLLFVFDGDIPTSHGHTGGAPYPFSPGDVVFDSVGNLVITDIDNSRILLLNGGGQFIKVLHTQTDYIWAVGIDSEDFLWVSTMGDKIQQLQYSNYSV